MSNNISQKLDYLEGTKDAIKAALINKEVPVTSETTFREYAQLIANMTVGRKVRSFRWNFCFY